MKMFTQNEPLTDAELDRLGDFLKSCKGGKAMNIEALDGFFEPQPSVYWSRRAYFGPTAFVEPVRAIGPGLARAITLNILLPYSAALAHHRRDLRLARATREVFRGFPPLESNAVTTFVQYRMLGARKERQWREWRRQLTSAARRQQGLHQLYRDRCARGPEGCDGCPVVGGMREGGSDV